MGEISVRIIPAQTVPVRSRGALGPQFHEPHPQRYNTASCGAVLADPQRHQWSGGEVGLEGDQNDPTRSGLLHPGIRHPAELHCCSHDDPIERRFSGPARCAVSADHRRRATSGGQPVAHFWPRSIAVIELSHDHTVGIHSAQPACWLADPVQRHISPSSCSSIQIRSEMNCSRNTERNTLSQPGGICPFAWSASARVLASEVTCRRFRTCRNRCHRPSSRSARSC